MKFKNTLVQSLPVVLALIFFSAVNATCSYMLSKRDHDIIKTAYMNGAVAVLSLDIDDISAMKDDRRLLKRLVETAAHRYLQTVDRLNQTGDLTVAARYVPRYRTVYLP